jgi:hypothetical protein
LPSAPAAFFGLFIDALRGAVKASGQQRGDAPLQAG